jgi:hypothetical protein
MNEPDEGRVGAVLLGWLWLVVYGHTYALYF